MFAFTRPLTLLLASCALLTAACDPDFDRDSADAVVAARDESVTPASLGLGDGWLHFQEGLWTRADAAGEQEYAAIGEAGTPARDRQTQGGRGRARARPERRAQRQEPRAPRPAARSPSPT